MDDSSANSSLSHRTKKYDCVRLAAELCIFLRTSRERMLEGHEIITSCPPGVPGPSLLLSLSEKVRE